MYCGVQYPMCIPICIDVYTKTYTCRYIHYTVLHKFCTVSCSRVYAVQCAHAAIPASAAAPPPPTLRSILGAAAAPSQQLFKPTADARLTDGHLNSSCIGDSLNPGSSSYSSEELASMVIVGQGGDWMRITRECLHQKLAAAVGGRSSCGCCSCFCPQNL